MEYETDTDAGRTKFMTAFRSAQDHIQSPRGQLVRKALLRQFKRSSDRLVFKPTNEIIYRTRSPEIAGWIDIDALRRDGFDWISFKKTGELQSSYKAVDCEASRQLVKRCVVDRYMHDRAMARFYDLG